MISSNFEVIGSRTALEMFGTVPKMFGVCAKNKGRCAINWMKLVTSKSQVKDWPRLTAKCMCILSITLSFSLASSRTVRDRSCQCEISQDSGVSDISQEQHANL